MKHVTNICIVVERQLAWLQLQFVMENPRVPSSNLHTVLYTDIVSGVSYKYITLTGLCFQLYIEPT